MDSDSENSINDDFSGGDDNSDDGQGLSENDSQSSGEEGGEGAFDDDNLEPACDEVGDNDGSDEDEDFVDTEESLIEAAMLTAVEMNNDEEEEDDEGEEEEEDSDEDEEEEEDDVNAKDRQPLVATTTATKRRRTLKGGRPVSVVRRGVAVSRRAAPSAAWRPKPPVGALVDRTSLASSW